MSRKNIHDLIVIGGGPAGLSAATAGAELGLKTLLLDDQTSPGGQLYRNIERVSPEVRQKLGPDYMNGLRLVETFRKSGADYQDGAVVWNIESNGHVFYSQKGKSTQVSAKKVVIAIGATERPVPFSGWTLPGVTGVGALDSNFKSSGSIPAGPVVLCGSGPLLLLVIGHLSGLGVNIKAVLDTTPSGGFLRSFPHLPGALKHWDYLFKGVGMLAKIRKAGVKYYRNITDYQAHGHQKLERVSFTSKGKKYQVETSMLLAHEGIVSRCDFSMLLGLNHVWEPVQRYWHPEVNQFGVTANENIYIAGDGAFVHGGLPAAIKGSLAALDIAEKLGKLSESEKIGTIPRLEKELSRELAPRPFVDAMYKPRNNLFTINDETLVCRCEEVTAGDIRQAVREGCREPNEIKALTRCGMGPCQGRMCGAALAEIVAAELGIDPSSLRPLNIRTPVRNLSLIELSEVELSENVDS